MGRKKGLNISRFLKGGFRGTKGFRLKVNLNNLEKLNVLTNLQHDIVKDLLDKCVITKTIKVEGKEDKQITTIIASPQYIARLDALLEKQVVEAKVNACGNPIIKEEKDELEKFKKKPKEEQLKILKEKFVKVKK